MIFKNFFLLRISVGILVTLVVLLGINKAFNINNDYKELAVTALLIVFIGQILLKVFKPYTFK